MSGDALRGKNGSDRCYYFRSMTGSRRVKRAREETVEEAEWRMEEQEGREDVDREDVEKAAP